MNKYGQAALNAVKLIENKQAASTIDAWNIATIASLEKVQNRKRRAAQKEHSLVYVK